MARRTAASQATHRSAATLERNLQQAVHCFRAGRVEDVVRLCQLVLKLVPNEPDALHLMGAA